MNERRPEQRPKPEEQDRKRTSIIDYIARSILIGFALLIVVLVSCTLLLISAEDLKGFVCFGMLLGFVVLLLIGCTPVIFIRRD